MANDARALLDSLMGSTRDIPLKEAKAKKGNNFKESNACKFYLLGFCPMDEELFRNTKRHLGECEKVHSLALREEFENSPDKHDHEVKYVRDLIRYLESIVRTANEAINRQARNIQAANKDLEERGPNEVAKREIDKIRENCSQLLNEAEELAENGDVEGSKQKQAIYDQTIQKANEYEERSKQPIKEEVCEVCGLRPEDGDGARKFDHTEGKIHVGFVKIREWLKTLKAKEEAWEKAGTGEAKDDKDGAGADGDKQRSDGDRDRDRKSRGTGDDKRRDIDYGGDRQSRGGGDRDRGERADDRRGGDRRGDRDSEPYRPRGGRHDREERGGRDRGRDDGYRPRERSPRRDRY